MKNSTIYNCKYNTPHPAKYKGHPQRSLRSHLLFLGGGTGVVKILETFLRHHSDIFGTFLRHFSDIFNNKTLIINHLPKNKFFSGKCLPTTQAGDILNFQLSLSNLQLPLITLILHTSNKLAHVCISK